MIIFYSFFLFMGNYSWAINLKARPLALRVNQCQSCHIQRTHREKFIPDVFSTRREHAEIKLEHAGANLSCNDCHDVNRANALMVPGTYANTSLLCSRCHSDRYKEWIGGSHGKKVGSWKNSISYHCIDCHSPHSISFKKLKSRQPPRIRQN